MSRSRTPDLDSRDLWSRARLAASATTRLPPASPQDPSRQQTREADRETNTRELTFDAADLREALRRARRELGGEAVIVSSVPVPREPGVRGWLVGGGLRVTAIAPARSHDARVPPPLAAGLAPAATHGSTRPEASPQPQPEAGAELRRAMGPLMEELRSLRTAVDDRELLRSEVAHIRSLLSSWQGGAPFSSDAEGDAAGRAFHLLLERGVDEPLARSLATRAVARVETSALADLNRLLLGIATAMREDLVRARRGAPPSRVQVFAGPGGVGKTTTIAKLAARATRIGAEGALIVTTDVERPAALAATQNLAESIGVPVAIARDATELARVLDRNPDRERVFVDTAAVVPGDAAAARRLADLCSALPEAELLLVSAATARAADSRALLAGFQEVAWSRTIVTRLDETRVFGELYNVVAHGRRPIAAVTTGRTVPGELESVDTASILRRVLHE